MDLLLNADNFLVVTILCLYNVFNPQYYFKVVHCSFLTYFTRLMIDLLSNKISRHKL